MFTRLKGSAQGLRDDEIWMAQQHPFSVGANDINSPRAKQGRKTLRHLAGRNQTAQNLDSAFANKRSVLSFLLGGIRSAGQARRFLWKVHLMLLFLRPRRHQQQHHHDDPDSDRFHSSYLGQSSQESSSTTTELSPQKKRAEGGRQGGKDRTWNRGIADIRYPVVGTTAAIRRQTAREEKAYWAFTGPGRERGGRGRRR